MIVTFDKGIALSAVNVRNIANRPKLVLNAWNFKLVFLIVKYFNLKITINTSKEKKDLKNIILKYFINKSFKRSDYIIYQLDHVAEKINIRFKSKLIKIGIIDKGEKDLNTEIGVIGIMSKTRNKNSNFMEEVLKRVSVDSPEYKITKFISTENQKHSEKNLISLREQYPKHNIYFHTSFYETVGLPLYEASSAGLFIVAPDSEYMMYFDNSNSIKYKPEDIESATRCIKDALNSNKKTIQSLHYKEDWNLVLESI